jgi:preprotein translocase SecE subunit
MRPPAEQPDMADETIRGDSGDLDEGGEVRPPSGAARVPREGAPSPFKIFKPGQGVHVRWGTAIGAGIIALAGASFVHEMLRGTRIGDQLVLRTLIPLALLVATVYLVFWLTGQRRGTVDFMIATEGEMKKVNWSTRREVLGATKVVIFTVFALGIMLALVDLVFMLLFSAIGVLKIPIKSALLGGGLAQ